MIAPGLRPSHMGMLRGQEAPGVVHTLTGRAHDDKFPLPLLDSCRGLAGPRLPRIAGRCFMGRCNRVVTPRNSLDAPCMPLRAFAPPMRWNAAYQSALLRVARRVQGNGPPPALDGRAALIDQLKAQYPYSGASSEAMSYDPGKFGVLQSGILARHLRDRLPASSHHFMWTARRSSSAGARASWAAYMSRGSSRPSPRTGPASSLRTAHGGEPRGAAPLHQVNSGRALCGQARRVIEARHRRA